LTASAVAAARDGADGIRGDAAGGLNPRDEACDDGQAEEGGRGPELAELEFPHPWAGWEERSGLAFGGNFHGTIILVHVRDKRSRLRTVPRGTPNPPNPERRSVVAGAIPTGGFTVSPLLP